MIGTAKAEPSFRAGARSVRAHKQQKIVGKGTIYALLVVGSLVFMLPLIVMI